MDDTVNEVLEDQETADTSDVSDTSEDPESDQVVTLQEAYDYIGIDYADVMVERNVRRVISTADAYLKGAVGTNYPFDDPRAKELALILVNDLYVNRGSANKVTNTVRKFVTDALLQLRLELRRTNGNDV